MKGVRCFSEKRVDSYNAEALQRQLEEVGKVRFKLLFSLGYVTSAIGLEILPYMSYFLEGTVPCPAYQGPFFNKYIHQIPPHSNYNIVKQLTQSTLWCILFVLQLHLLFGFDLLVFCFGQIPRRLSVFLVLEFECWHDVC